MACIHSSLKVKVSDLCLGGCSFPKLGHGLADRSLFEGDKHSGGDRSCLFLILQAARYDHHSPEQE